MTSPVSMYPSSVEGYLYAAHFLAGLQTLYRSNWRRGSSLAGSRVHVLEIERDLISSRSGPTGNACADNYPEWPTVGCSASPYGFCIAYLEMLDNAQASLCDTPAIFQVRGCNSKQKRTNTAIRAFFLPISAGTESTCRLLPLITSSPLYTMASTTMNITLLQSARGERLPAVRLETQAPCIVDDDRLAQSIRIVNDTSKQSHAPAYSPAHPSTFLALVAEHERRVQAYSNTVGEEITKIEPIQINGDELTMAELVAVACHNAPVQLSEDEKVRDRVNSSVDFLRNHLKEGNTVYGINTGFGGSADTRSQDFLSVQRGLVQHQNSAVLLSSDIGQQESELLSHLDKHHLPRAVVRGSMLTRCNSLMRGHSAVRLSVIETLIELLNRDYVPIVPLRGSISASGDLAPLSYIAGSLEGNSDIYLDCRMLDGGRKVLNAQEALNHAGLSPITMMPKEGLGLINGTAVSTAAGSLVLHETQYLLLCSQALTGMATEALRGSADNYHPFISQVRPHAGQTEVGNNIATFLRGSRLIVGKTRETAGLYQDRYGLRTAPQWIGPQLEDVGLALEQVRIELNSTTDNPLIDVEDKMVHHGGNFQAASITSAMEKTRLSLQMLGRLMFAQCSEMINPTFCFDDPGVSFTFKGVDINMAAYMSELAFLANPVSSHVQSAELHNQAVNSLALISARYTMDAVEMVSLMTAAYFYAVCQALDLHVLHMEYTVQIERAAIVPFTETFTPLLPETVATALFNEVLRAIHLGLKTSRHSDTPARAKAAAETTILPITQTLLANLELSNDPNPFSLIPGFVTTLTEIIITAISTARAAFTSPAGPPTVKYLSHGSTALYRFIRNDLGIPLHKGLVEHPPYPDTCRDGIHVAPQDRRTIGSRVGVIYAALRSGRFGPILLESLS
nr:phenylalanine aminomutase (l-beta-phenylalanine forming) [Quercus suber]